MWKRPFDKDFVLFNLHHVHGFKFPVDKENPGFYVWKPNGMSRGIISLGLERRGRCVNNEDRSFSFFRKRPSFLNEKTPEAPQQRCGVRVGGLRVGDLRLSSKWSRVTKSSVYKTYFTLLVTPFPPFFLFDCICYAKKMIIRATILKEMYSLKNLSLKSFLFGFFCLFFSCSFTIFFVHVHLCHFKVVVITSKVLSWIHHSISP